MMLDEASSIVFAVNGKKQVLADLAPATTLSDYLRSKTSYTVRTIDNMLSFCSLVPRHG